MRFAMRTLIQVRPEPQLQRLRPRGELENGRKNILTSKERVFQRCSCTVIDPLHDESNRI